ncbi:acyltransferase domain-containing protein [Acuticoccus sediminis]|uniref:acyltransferase domain-containing protein n=1 Tax=Acuticoccus sediminis TaxID=2184697 RepID=UPI001CFD1DE5|nr:acyltransferase domain-containing protein [Acuticoccus sediminis]
MSGVAILCSGQGLQGPAMLDALTDAPAAAAIFTAARAMLGGEDPRDVVRRADERMHDNAVAQILCAVEAMAWWAVLRESVSGPLIVAGYSAGELPAWGLAGVLDGEAVLRLVARRAAAMDEATTEPCGLAAILGLPHSQVEKICASHRLHIAIVNGPDHVVVGGRESDLAPGLAAACGEGARRVVRLAVHVASHTPLLCAATRALEPDFTAALGRGPLPPGVRVIAGANGRSVHSREDGARLLAVQISAVLRWDAVMDAVNALAPVRVIELGPGDALARMMAQSCGVDARSTADFRSIVGVRRWLGRA